MRWLRRVPESLPRRRVFPVLGALFALGAPLGLLVLRAVLAGKAPTPALLVAETEADPVTLGYLVFTLLLVFVLLGRALGAREDELATTSMTDPLTGLSNRRHLDARLAEEIARLARYEGAATVLLLDVDHLKEINDRGGHEAGDAALLAVAEALRHTCRAMDLPSRYGGDEFAVLLPETTAVQGLELAERIRAALRDMPGAPTVSIGIADLDAAAAPRPLALMEAADAALYAAKKAGRDRAALAPSSPPRTSPLGEGAPG
ncbi:GGDEF domain-containing protein [Polyangium sp. y55x31]|uniref:GGDEF domain-containing protein n=1 Tax=Polyangium sp. y55x31 TaxID=3042688 RepID=UPI0024822FC0|nr:GGDEF domain-containing protein [Polyangium sp. y55x31]MDI1477400.1 GGDEF domain-containing protein [Polyangium sp. y55x31]